MHLVLAYRHPLLRIAIYLAIRLHAKERIVFRRRILSITQSTDYPILLHTMKHIIENPENSHINAVKSLLARSDRAIIISPFISNDAVDMLRSKLARLKSLTLVTTFKREGCDQIKKTPVFRSLFSICGAKGTFLSIKIDNKLHGKVYIGIKKRQYIGAIITSANFTRNGLVANHEWGYYIEDFNEISQLSERILKDTVCDIDNTALTTMEKAICDLGISDNLVRPKVGIDLLDMVRPTHISHGDKITFWLKPLGTIDNPIAQETKFDYNPFRMTFARGVKSIKEGDVIIAYAVKARRILSIFTATSNKGMIDHFENEREKRWPYFVMCDNRAVQFGANWGKINLSLDSLSKSFLDSHPQSFLHHESKTLSVFQWGLDRLRINREFAEYIIDEVINNQ